MKQLFLAVPLLLAAVPAQTAAPATSPHILIDSVGPDGWRMRMGPTNLGSLLESEKGHALWEPRVLPMLGMWQQLIGDEAAFEAARARLINYGGRIRIGAWLPTEAGNRQSPANHVAIVLDGDGRTDLTALAADLRNLQSKMVPGEWQQRDVAGAKVTVRTEGSNVMCEPLREGDHLVIALAADDDIGGALLQARALAATATGKPPAPNTPALRVQFDFAAIVAMAMATNNASEQIWMRAFGLPSLGNGAFAISTAGPHVQVEVSQQFSSDDRGLFGALFPSTAAVPSLLQAIPTGKETWKVGHLDLSALYTVIEKAVVESEKRDAEELRAEIQKEIGVDLQKDVLAHLTDDVMLTATVPEGIVEDTTWSLTFRLRDTAAFEKSLQTMLPKAKPFLSREAEEKHGDIPVYRYGGVFGYDLWLSVGNGVWVVAGGRDAEELIGSVLDRAKALPATPVAAATATTMPKGFEALQRFVPPGLNGFGKGDLGSVIALPSELWSEMFGMLLPMPRMGSGQSSDPEQQAEILAMLRQHNLDVLRTASGYAERTWRWRLFW